MLFFLAHRNAELQECMDAVDCDPVKLRNTYKQFWWINRFLSRWNVIYKKEIRPILESQNGTATLLDIGFGGGDIPIHLNNLAKADGFQLQITAIEADKRSYNFVKSVHGNSDVSFKNMLSTDLVAQKERFDFVISNHLVHHLDNITLKKICTEAEQLATKKVIFNDLKRSDLAYALFYIFSKILFWNSFVSVDGLVSIKRSYTFEELKEIAPDGWKVRKLFPFRLILSYEQ